MASYGATVLGRVKKKDTDDTVSKRKQLINSSMGLETVKPKVGDATKYPSVSQRGPTIRTNTNTTSNSRKGQKYAVLQQTTSTALFANTPNR